MWHRVCLLHFGIRYSLYHFWLPYHMLSFEVAILSTRWQTILDQLAFSPPGVMAVLIQ